MFDHWVPPKRGYGAHYFSTTRDCVRLLSIPRIDTGIVGGERGRVFDDKLLVIDVSRGTAIYLFRKQFRDVIVVGIQLIVMG